MAVGIAAEIKSKLSIVDVIGEVVPLKKAGTTYKGLCPFHGEKTPSFVVTPSRDSWKCFGCGEGGDIFSFFMLREGLSFPEALKFLAAKAGVELDERASRDDARRARLHEVVEHAIAFYHVVLTQHRSGQPALDYLRGRGFTDETIGRFQLGWSPAGWDEMGRMLQARRSVRPEELVEVGLTTPRAGGRGAYDRFRSRIIFPIRDAAGAAVGLGGRILPGGAPAGDGVASDGGRPAGDGGPKYLNSPATPIFDKSRTLYLIDRAKGPMRRGEQAVVVEGYTDALMAHQAGFDNVVASLGTALTPGQVALMTRYAKRIALAYDVDPAGQSAGTFGVTELNSLISEVQASGTVGLTDVGVVRLPEGKDPDEVIRDTPDLWREATRVPDPILAFLIDHRASQVDVRTPEGRKRLVDAVLPTLRRVADPIVRDAYLQVLARRSGVEERTLLEALHRPEPGQRSGRAADGEHAGSRITLDAVLAADDALDPEGVVRSMRPVEVELLRLLLLVPEQQEPLAAQLTALGLALPSTPARVLLAAMLAERERDREAGGPGRFERGRFLDALDPETRGIAVALYARRGPDLAELDPRRVAYAVDQCLLRLEEDRLEETVAYTRAEIAEAESRGDPESVARLLEDERHHLEARRALDQRRGQMSLLARSSGGTR